MHYADGYGYGQTRLLLLGTKMDSRALHPAVIPHIMMGTYLAAALGDDGKSLTANSSSTSGKPFANGPAIHHHIVAFPAASCGDQKPVALEVMSCQERGLDEEEAIGSD